MAKEKPKAKKTFPKMEDFDDPPKGLSDDQWQEIVDRLLRALEVQATVINALSHAIEAMEMHADEDDEQDDEDEESEEEDEEEDEDEEKTGT